MRAASSNSCGRISSRSSSNNSSSTCDGGTDRDSGCDSDGAA